jgi:hypothetical protein
VQAGSSTPVRGRRRALLFVSACGAVAALAASVVVSCVPGGRSAAVGTGGIVEPQVERGSPLALFDRACGAPPAADHPALRRSPYLQRVTAAGADVVWTAVAEAPGRLLLTDAGGARVTEVEAPVDATARLPGRARQHVARLSGLAPATTYCYALWHGEERVAGPIPFRTAPAPGGGPVRVLAFGDSGEGGGDQALVLGQMQTVPFDLMIHTGDIAYDDGRLEDFEQKFFGVYGDLLRSIPMFPTSGNHEYETDDAAPYRQVFVLPENGGDAGRERWYSFDWGDVHFVALDTEKMGPAQAEWLDRDLAQTRLPWTIVFAHRPPYSSGDHGSSMTFRRVFGPILERHRVPLVLTGHDHHYERFNPQGGVTYVVTGGGGKGTRGMRGGPQTAYGEEVLNFVQLTIDGDRLVLHAIDGVGREFDGAIIPRPDTAAAAAAAPTTSSRAPTGP